MQCVLRSACNEGPLGYKTERAELRSRAAVSSQLRLRLQHSSGSFVLICHFSLCWTCPADRGGPQQISFHRPLPLFCVRASLCRVDFERGPVSKKPNQSRRQVFFGGGRFPISGSRIEKPKQFLSCQQPEPWSRPPRILNSATAQLYFKLHTELPSVLGVYIFT